MGVLRGDEPRSVFRLGARQCGRAFSCNLDLRIREEEKETDARAPVSASFARGSGKERRLDGEADPLAARALEHTDRSSYTVRITTTRLRGRERARTSANARASCSRPRGLSATPPNPPSPPSPRAGTCLASTAAGVAFCRRGRFEPTPVPDATPPAFARSRHRAPATLPLARSRRSSGRAATCLCRRSHRGARKAPASRRVFSNRRAMARGRWRPASRAGPPADAPSPRSRDARSARARGARRGLSTPPGCAPRRVAAPSWRARGDSTANGLGVEFERLRAPGAEMVRRLEDWRSGVWCLDSGVDQ